jgi:hypothetical protein
MPCGDVVMVLSIVLRIKRTLDGAEIEQDHPTRGDARGVAAEHRRRADWRKGELAAERFCAECDHADAVALPRSAPDRLR